MSKRSRVRREVPQPIKRFTRGAAKGMCVHRVSLDAWCARCARGESH